MVKNLMIERGYKRYAIIFVKIIVGLFILPIGIFILGWECHKWYLKRGFKRSLNMTKAVKSDHKRTKTGMVSA